MPSRPALCLQEVFTFIQELLSVIPESHFHRRKAYDIKEVVQFAKNESFTDLILVNEYRKKPRAWCARPRAPPAPVQLCSPYARVLVPPRCC